MVSDEQVSLILRFLFFYRCDVGCCDIPDVDEDGERIRRDCFVLAVDYGPDRPCGGVYVFERGDHLVWGSADIANMKDEIR